MGLCPQKEAFQMIYKGIVKGNVVQLEGKAILPEGLRVNVIPEEELRSVVVEHPQNLKVWLQDARQVRAQLPETSDSVDILRELRVERASR
jgi:hypothetical protein